MDHETQNAYNLISGKLNPLEHKKYKVKKGQTVLRNLGLFSLLPMLLLLSALFMNNSVTLSYFGLFMVLFMSLVYSYISGNLNIFY